MDIYFKTLWEDVVGFTNGISRIYLFKYVL